jgi:hypothetical protein
MSRSAKSGVGRIVAEKAGMRKRGEHKINKYEVPG